MNKYNRKTRQDEILSMLKSNEYMSVQDLVEKFDCSLSTIRSDLANMEEQGMLIRTLGGAKPLWSQGAYQIKDRLGEQTNSKRAIAKYVVDHLIKENTTIVLDAGTTAFEVARMIAARDIEISVLTCSLLVSHILSESRNVKLFSFGGFYDREGGYFYDEFMQEYARILHADVFFMGVNGVSPEVGFSIAYRDEAIIKNMLMNIASKTIVLCDSSKLMQNNCRVVADFIKVPLMVTDAMAPPDEIEKLRLAGLDVRVAQGDD